MKIEEVLNSLPEVSFIENKTYEEVKEEMLSDFLEEFKRISGESVSVSEASMYMALLNTASIQIYQIYEYVDYAGKMGLVKYAWGEFLDNLAIMKGIVREEAREAFCEMEFRLSAVSESAVSIPKGTRVTDGNLYFLTEEYTEIKPGEVSVKVRAVCSEKGTVGNGIGIGKINTLVNPIPYMENVRNVTESAGGREKESDEEMKVDFVSSQSVFSTTGSEEAYKYFAKKADERVADAVVESKEDANVEITISKKEDGVPDSSLINIVYEYLKAKDRKTLTDKIVVKAPEQVEYDVAFTYYISNKDKLLVEKIKAEVDKAVQSYVGWQGEKMGRDINPSVLIQKLMNTGIKRIDITTPVFSVIASKQIAKKRNLNVVYGGLEDD